MKSLNIKYATISALAISSLLIGCSEDVYDDAYKPSLESHYLSVYPRDFEFGNGEETKSGSITSEYAWSFASVPSWLSLTPTSGNSNADFSVTSTANETFSSKTAVFYWSTNASEWSLQKTITASQAAASPSFSFVDLESTSLYLTGESHTLTIDVETNLDDLATIIYDDAESWMSASYQNKQLTITINVNDSGYRRSGRVELWSSSHYKGGTIHITQYEPKLSFNEISSLSFDADGGSQNVSVSSEISWFALSNESWIEITPSEGNAGNNQVKITALPSYQSGSRNGMALLYYKDNQSAVDRINITQSGRYINLTPNSVTLSAAENSSETVDIDSNIGWEVSNYPEWISLSQNKGNAGNSTLTITAQKNNSLNSRSGTITIKDSMTGGIEKSLSVVQDGLDFGDNTLEFSWHQSSINLDVPIIGAWSAAVSDGWITLSEYIGSGEKEIVVSVSKNESENLRTGEILFTSEGKTIEVAVIQSGQYINLDNTSGEFSALGGSITLMVASSVNTSWKLEYSNPDDNFVTVNKTSDEEYSIKVDYNPSSLERNATFILNPTDNDVSDIYTPGVKFAIKQFGRDLSCETSKIFVFASGGTSQTYKISAEGKYSIEKAPGDNWYTIVSDTASQIFYIVVTDNNSDSDRTGRIILSLLELPNGESVTRDIEVLQLKWGVNIYFDNFDEETIW